jgi:hypothetical protein
LPELQRFDLCVGLGTGRAVLSNELMAPVALALKYLFRASEIMSFRKNVSPLMH